MHSIGLNDREGILLDQQPVQFTANQADIMQRDTLHCMQTPWSKIAAVGCSHEVAIS